MDNLFIRHAAENPAFFFSWVIIITFSICVHEYAHARMALRLGDYTAALTGHLTLNPLKQMGPFSLVMLMLAGIAWGAVPVNPSAYRSRADAARVSFAGPASNLLLCSVFALLSIAAGRISPVSAEGFSALHPASFFEMAALANAVLFLLNMLPIPMLDGWALIAMTVTGAETWRLRQGRQLSFLFIALIFFTPVLGWIWRGGDLLSKAFLTAADRLLFFWT